MTSGKSDLSALLFLSCRYNKTHKLVLLKAANLSMNQMTALSEEIFERNANALRIARVDFAVDVPGISTKWFREHLRLVRKRTFSETGPTENRGGNGATLYFGRSPDLIRVYDKSAERKRRNQLRSGVNPDSSSREAVHPLNDDRVLTRVERQLRSGRIPSELATLELLHENAMKFNPFTHITIVPGGMPNPNVSDYSIRCYLEGLGLRTAIAEMGLAGAWRLMSARSGGNANRIIERLADFVPPTPFSFHSDDLFRMYQWSVGPQLSGGPLRVASAH